MPEVIRDALPEFLGGMFVIAVVALVGLLWQSRSRLRELVYGPRLTVHVWQDVAIDGNRRRIIPWPALVVGLGKDPVRRGNLEPLLKARIQDLKKPDPRKFFVSPLYPLGKSVTGGADSLVGVHVAIFNSGQDILIPEEVGSISLRIDVPSLHLLDWAREVFDEPGWERSLDPSLMGEECWDDTKWYEHGGRTIADDGPTDLGLGLKNSIRPDDSDRDTLAVLVSTSPGRPIEVNVSVVAKANKVPLLVKPWRPARRGERIRHPLRTIWRRLIVARREPPKTKE